MALKSTYKQADLFKQADDIHQRMVQAHMRTGEIFITEAREQPQSHALGTYNDQTTNLRNSISYFVFDNGYLIELNDQTGSNLVKVEPYTRNRGIQLIGIAGMEYASAVEAMGYNVISNQARAAVENLKMYLDRIATAAGKAKY